MSNHSEIPKGSTPKHTPGPIGIHDRIKAAIAKAEGRVQE
jgi:hypothetical protein